MTAPLAVSTGTAILSVIGLVAGLLVLGLVGMLFNQIMRPAREIERYADDILEAGVGIAGNLDGADELARTRELALALPGLATAYLAKLDSGS